MAPDDTKPTADSSAAPSTTQVTAAPVADESLLEKVEDALGEVGEKIGDALHWTEEKIVICAKDFDEDVWPYIKKYGIMLGTQLFQVGLKASIAALPLLATGGFAVAGAEVGGAIAAALPIDAIADGKQILTQAQAALQVVKVVSGTSAPADAAQADAIVAAIPNTLVQGQAGTEGQVQDAPKS